MPKAEKGTPKDIAKRIKAKGLQKLKFYCQMCEKQCRDANGFKCHLTSESHLRQMKIFSENAKGIMDRYSKEFESAYLTTLRQRHTTKRVNANNVYQEVIQDKGHIHMNATRWATLSDFVMYLGKTGRCVVDETERGWYIQYIENDAGILARKEKQEQRAAAEKQAELLQAAQMEKQRVEAAKAFDRVINADGGESQREATNMEKRNENEKTTITLAATTTAGDSNNKKKKKKKKSATKLGFFGDDDDDDEDESEAPPSTKIPLPPPPLPASSSSQNNNNKRPADGGPAASASGSTAAAQEQQQQQRKEDSNKRQKLVAASDEDNQKKDKKKKHKEEKQSTADDDEDDDDDVELPWLKRDIVVRIVTKKLDKGGASGSGTTKYFKRKGIVDRFPDKTNKFVAEIVLLEEDGQTETDVILKLDQKDLDTVVPKKLGSKVRILKGKHRGSKAKLLEVDKKKYRATLELINSGDDDSDSKPIVLEKVDFEDFSQMA